MNENNVLLLLISAQLGIIISFSPIFTDPFHQETRGFTFWEWLSRELEELRTGERNAT